MRKILLLFTLVLVQLLSFGASAQTYSASGTVGIGFGPDRILIEGATVYADVQSGSNYVPVAGATCVTDAEGKWAISSLAPGTYQFRAEKPGYQMTPMSGVQLPFEGGNIDGFLNISAVIIETTLTGTVYDSWSASTTVRDIHVQVWNADQTTLLGEADCNTSQKFSIVLKGEVPSTVVLKISAPGYKTLVTTENINMGYTNTFSNLRIDEGSDEPVASTYSAGGTVKDDAGAAVAGATITLEKKGEYYYETVAGVSATTDAQGVWSIGELENGTYKFTVNAAGYKAASVSDKVIDGADISGIDFTISKTKTYLRGTLGDSDDHWNTVKGGHVKAYSTDATPVLLAEADCSASGSYELVFEGLSGEEYYVNVESSAPGYATMTERRKLNVGYSNSYSPYLVPKVTYTVSGVVKNEAGEALADVEIYADLNNTRVGETKTDAEGKWTLAGLEAGTYNFRALGPNWLSAGYNNNTEISANKSDINFTLTEKTSQIAITVWRADLTGKVDGAHVEIWTQDETPVLVGEGTSNSQGAVPQIPIKGKMGTYTLKATAEGFKPYSKDYTPKFYGQSNQTSIMMEVAPPTYTVGGVVKDEAGNAIADAEVLVRMKNAEGSYVLTEEETRTAEDGTWSVTLANGDYQLQVLATGYKSNYATYTTVTDADVNDLAVVLNYTVTGISGSFYNKDTLGKIEGGHIEFWTQGENPVKVAEADGDLDGNYPMVTIKGVTGTYDVKATAPGFEPYTGTCKPNNGQTGNKCSPMMTPLPPVYTASGVVKDQEGNAVEGVGIYVSRKGEDGRFETLTGVNATTDAQGAWSIADLSAGTYQFRALKDGYKAAYNNDVELAADKADLDFTLEYAESTIGGMFLDKETLAPIAGGHIELWSTGENPELVYEATSNTEGKYPGFRVYGPFKTYTVKATAAGYEDYESEYTPSIYGQLNNCRVLMTASEWTFTAVVKGNQENGEVALLDKAVVTVTAEKQNESPKEVEVTNEGNGFYSFTVKGPETVDVTYVVKVTCEGYDGEGEYSFSFDGKDVEHEFVLNQTVGIARILQEMGEDTPIYTVNGLRVNSKEIKNLAPGIYIVGDRKVIVK